MLKRISKMIVMALLVFNLSVISAFAITPEEAQSALSTQAYSEISGEKYELSGGGSIEGSKLFKATQDGGYTIIPEKFDELSRSAQKKFATKLGTVVENSYKPEGEDGSLVEKGVTKESALDWLKRMTNYTPGLGTHMMLTLTNGLQPDFISAKQFVQPLEGPLGTLVGVIAMAIFLVLAVLIVSDIAYLSNPTLQGFVSSEGGFGSKGGGFRLISKDAIKSSQEAETSSGALLMYLKRRFLSLVALAFVMFYLVMGRMYELVGTILDLFSGLAGV